MKNKIFAWAVLGLSVVGAWVSWAVLAGAVFGTIEHIWLYPILVFSFWGVVFTLAAIFVRSKKYFYASLAAGAVAYPIFFGFSLSILGVALAILLLALLENQTKKEIVRGIRINFYRVASHALKYFVTVICLVIAVAYYFSITEKSSVLSPSLLERQTLEAEMDWGLKAAGLVLSEDKREIINDISNNITVDEFLSKNFVKPEIDRNALSGSPADTTKLIGNTAALEVQQAILEKSKRDLARQLGVNVVGEQPMKEVLMAYIDKTERSFFEYSGSDKFYVPVVLALGLFLTARVLGAAVEIFLGFFILGIIKLLRIFKIVEVKYEEREVAVIEYSI